jgi:hypothetical protein
MIIIHIPFSDDTRPYADYCFDAMRRMATNPNEVVAAHHVVDGPIRFAADNHSRAVGEAFRATAHHPDALHVICDSDTVVVMMDWDNITRQLLQTYDCVGTSYQRIGTAATGHGKKQTYKDKPNVEWLALGPNKPWHMFVPEQTNQFDKPVLVQTPEDETLWNLPRGYELLQDACWNLPLFLRDQGLTCWSFTNVEPRDYVALRGFTEHEEWHLNGTPFVVHQGKSRKHRFRQTPFSRNFYNHVAGMVRPTQSS